MQSSTQQLASVGETSISHDLLFFFYPELLSKMSLKDLTATLNPLVSTFTGRLVILTFFLSRWALEELKIHPLFKYMHFYTLALNDKFLDHKILHVMEELNPNLAEKQAWLEEKER
jgi:hypothetical protein